MSEAPAPVQRFWLGPDQHADLRRQVLGWAVGTAAPGEAPDAVLERAQGYLDFILYPLRHDVAQATLEAGQAEQLH